MLEVTLKPMEAEATSLQELSHTHAETWVHSQLNVDINAVDLLEKRQIYQQVGRCKWMVWMRLAAQKPELLLHHGQMACRTTAAFTHTFSLSPLCSVCVILLISTSLNVDLFVSVSFCQVRFAPCPWLWFTFFVVLLFSSVSSCARRSSCCH